MELLTTAPAFYYFRFTSRQTNQVVQFTVADISPTQRYQKFIIDASVKFANQKEGTWSYEIKPTANNNNTDPGGVACESGIAYISTAAQPLNAIYDEQNNAIRAYTK